MERTKLLFGCYRRADANDPEIYTAAVAATLAEFSIEVVEYVTDPRTGLAATLKWLPTIAEIREACEKRAEYRRNVDYMQSKGYRLVDGRFVKQDDAA